MQVTIALGKQIKVTGQLVQTALLGTAALIGIDENVRMIF